ncbi:MAG: hypothetical protein LBC99_05675, partial [Spirochaetota bacterium]|nr:hypothetical protein [Spirochaetota bacterium]
TCLFAVLVLTFAFAACGSDDDDGADTWKNVTSLQQIVGTWKTTYTQTETVQGITIKVDAEVTLVITASSATAGTMSGTMKTTMTFSGDNINTYWPYLLEQYPASEGWTPNNTAHSVTQTESIPSESVTLSDLDGAQINQNGTKMKQPANDDEDSPEMIFIKQ